MIFDDPFDFQDFQLPARDESVLPADLEPGLPADDVTENQLQVDDVADDRQLASPEVNLFSIIFDVSLKIVGRLAVPEFSLGLLSIEVYSQQEQG